ncbi:MAG TPA: hypothetical protein VFP98_07740, partial [Candidatus Polarisedimenticolia bacterium]|nr:hypothetical protein [Candidatus Polarisedimenticolia bacterium]
MKYRHKGYRDSEKKDRERKKEPAPPRSPEQRQLRHMMERSATLVLRCYQCSVEARDVESLTGASTCPGCGAAL